MKQVFRGEGSGDALPANSGVTSKSAYVEAIYAYAKAHNLAVVRFEKGQDKDKTARPFLEVAAGEGKDRVVLIGIAQEKASVWRSWKSKGQEKAAHPHMEWGRQMAYINHFYFYLWDSEWGAAFWKTNAYAPIRFGSGSTAMSGLNGNSGKLELLLRPSTMGFRSCEDSAALQKICDRLGPWGGEEFLLALAASPALPV